MTFKEELIKEAESMQKVLWEICTNAIFIAEERKEFEKDLKRIKEIISYLAD